MAHFTCRYLSGQLACELKISPLLAQVLINRGVKSPEEAKSFLNPKLNDLIEPELMPGVNAAVDRIEKAVKDKKKSLSTAIMTLTA